MASESCSCLIPTDSRRPLPTSPPAIPIVTSADHTDLCIFHAMRRLHIHRGQNEIIGLRLRLPVNTQADWEARGGISAEVLGTNNDGWTFVRITGCQRGEAELVVLSDGRPIGQIYLCVVSEDDTIS